MNKDLLCPGNVILSQTSGSITSPFYPRLYPDNEVCSWQITAKQGNRVKLEITAYNIQQCGPDCMCDYLQVTGSSDDATGKICGVSGINPITFYSLQESLTVLFVSDSTESKSYDGFKATYQQFTAFSLTVALAQDSACNSSGLVLSGSSGFLWSPNFPNNFPANSNCTWNITVPSGKIIKMSFLNFTLESGQNKDCAGAPKRNARLSITNVASDDGKSPFQLCGQDFHHPVYSEGNSVLVRFVSGSNIERGFNASYEAMNKDLLCPENMTLHETSGSITSPFYPRLYPDNQTCSWQITAKQGNRVKLEITAYNIQYCGPDCTCDYLQVQNGFSEDATGKICGVSFNPITYYSLQESLTVLFASDSTHSKSYEGFEATYQQLNHSPPICPKEAIPLSDIGTFSSPNYPMSNYTASTECFWIITEPAGKYVKLVFTDFALSSCTASCSSASCSYVELYDGGSDSSPSLGRFCGGPTPQPTFSSGHQMFVKFNSGNTVDRGFEAKYSAVSSTGCPTNMILSETSGSITSPLYPGNYPDNQNCSWQITAKQGNRVKLEITEYNIQYCGADCTCDYLQVLHGFSNDATQKKLCGVSSITYYSLKESLTVLFVSDSTQSEQDGFNATYQQLNYSPPICPREPYRLSGNGTFSSPNYPMSNYTASTECTWNITAPAGKYVKLVFTDFALSSCAASCSSDSCSYVELYDGGSDSSSSLGRSCGGPTPQPTFSSGHQMFIKFNSGNTVDRGFEAKYSVVSPTVDTFVLGNSSGFFWSPNFPNNFPAKSDYTWNITVLMGKIIKISFLSFTLKAGDKKDCAGAPSGSARVFITNVASDDGNTPFQLCGQRLPAPVYSEGNSIQVRFVSGSTVERGFNASYEAMNKDLLCPRNMILSETSGSITSPFRPRLYPDNQMCSWQITAEQGNLVQLEITKYKIQSCDPRCTCDYLQVQNGFSEDATGKICGESLNTITYYSLQESLTVLFVSDSTQSKLFDGFEATYQQFNHSPPICPNEAIRLSGSGKLSSPNYPMSNYSALTNCTWIVTVPDGKFVKLVFTDFALSSCAGSCSSDSCSYVELYDGGSDSSRFLGRFCRRSTPGLTFSSGSQMFIKFHSGQTVDRGFEANYSSVYTYIRPDDVKSDRAQLYLKESQFLKNGNRAIYVQIIVIQLKDDSHDYGASTDNKYAAENIKKDYKNKEEGEAYITAEFDYLEFDKVTIGDGKFYSRSAAGSTEYLNGELESNKGYAVFQRSFDKYGYYDSERFIYFKTKESSFLMDIVTALAVVAGFLFLSLIAVCICCCWKRKKPKRAALITEPSATEMVEIDPNVPEDGGQASRNE